MRVKRGLVSKRKHNKTLSLAKGYRGSRSKLIKVAKQATLQAGQYAFQGRKNRKKDFRSLWVTRIAEAVRKQDLSYSEFIHKLHDSKIGLDRKILSDLVLSDPETFEALVEMVKKPN